MIWYNIFLTAIRLSPGGSSTVHIYTQTISRTTQLTTGRLFGIRTQSGQTNWEECGPCPVFASYTLALTLQLREKHGKTSVRVAEECQLARWKQNIQNIAYITIRIHEHNNKNKLYYVKIWRWFGRHRYVTVSVCLVWQDTQLSQ